MALDEERFFYRTGRRASTTLRPVTEAALRPALFAQVSDLTSLRYDFPVVLVSRPGDDTWIEPLSALVDVTLAEVAPAGSAGERFRRTVLRLEREIRILLAEDAQARGTGGRSDDALASLEDLWNRAQARLTIAGGDPAAAEIQRARAALQARDLFGGLVADCDAGLPSHLVAHAWSWVEARKADRMRQKISTLLLTLGNLVRADYMRSEAGRGAETLAAGVGGAHRGMFDFGVMAQLLAAPSGASALPATRRARIDGTIEALSEQQFFGPSAFTHRFDRVAAALAAWRERQPAMAHLVRAIAIAELEVGGRYSEARHDDFFASFDASSVGDEERVLFPDYLVTVGTGSTDTAGRALLLEALAGEAPIKILLETNDPFGLGGQLATTAMGLGTVFVLQAPSAHLYAVRDQVLGALEYGGPALLSVFTGTFDGGAALPPYLVSAAALASRTFPAFAYDPAAGPDWAQRFALLANPQPDRPWPVHELHYADAAMARASEMVAITPMDLALCDPGRQQHFARTPIEHWEGLVPAGDWLTGASANGGAAPFVPAVDPQGRLAKLAVDDVLVREARRAADAWHRLQQLDDMKRERIVIVEAPTPAASAAPGATTAASEAAAATATAPGGAPAAGSVPTAPGAEAAPAPAAEPERNPDEAYIETWRCTTCNECTGVNARMFAYNENRQAYIKDITAGSYRDLVNAAESCQVAIIHPGKPRDPNEADLAELIERAQPFL